MVAIAFPQPSHPSRLVPSLIHPTSLITLAYLISEFLIPHPSIIHSPLYIIHRPHLISICLPIALPHAAPLTPAPINQFSSSILQQSSFLICPLSLTCHSALIHHFLIIPRPSSVPTFFSSFLLPITFQYRTTCSCFHLNVITHRLHLPIPIPSTRPPHLYIYLPDSPSPRPSSNPPSLIHSSLKQARVPSAAVALSPPAGNYNRGRGVPSGRGSPVLRGHSAMAVATVEDIRRIGAGTQPWALNNTALKSLRDSNEEPPGYPVGVASLTSPTWTRSKCTLYTAQ